MIYIVECLSLCLLYLLFCLWSEARVCNWCQQLRTALQESEIILVLFVVCFSFLSWSLIWFSLVLFSRTSQPNSGEGRWQKPNRSSQQSRHQNAMWQNISHFWDIFGEETDCHAISSLLQQLLQESQMDTMNIDEYIRLTHEELCNQSCAPELSASIRTQLQPSHQKMREPHKDSFLQNLTKSIMFSSMKHIIITRMHWLYC